MRGTNFKVDRFTCYVSGIVWTICFTAWLFFGRSIYEIGTAFAIFGGFGYFTRRENTILSRILYFFACNNLFDETFGNPYVITWTEYAIAVLFVLYYSFLHRHIPTLKYRFEKWLKQILKRT